ncbi:MAG: LLM class flavin-dependent oxidoreductase [Aeromicrobium sp.]
MAAHHSRHGQANTGPAGDLPVEVSINRQAGPLRDMPAAARAAEQAGFDALRIGDMQSTSRELYTTLTMIAASTSVMKFGSGVTNPVTRHPSVAASAFASLHELSGGRVVMGIGPGDSAVHNSGISPAKLADLEEYVTTVRSLHTTGRATYRGKTVALDWWTGEAVPIVMSAHGPRSLRLAGRVADGVVVGLGMGAAARELAAEQIARGAQDAGRDPSQIAVWHLSYLNIADSVEKAAAQVGSVLAVGGNLLARSAGRVVIPDALRPAFDELAQRYDYIRHADSAATSPNAALIEELGLIDYLAEQFGVFGTPRQIRTRLQDLAGVGVSRHWGGYVLPDYFDFCQTWGSDVVGRVDA